MRTQPELQAMAERMLGAWNTHEVDKVLAVYTEDLVYRDPNTRGEVNGADGMRRYLAKLFSAWTMHWSLREVHGFAGTDGAAVLWRARLGPKDSGRSVEINGMDLVVLRGDRLLRNEVYFDRAALAPLLAES